MSNRLVVDGSWPDSLTFTRGWARVDARPWNDDVGSGHVRLVRGSATFLDEVTRIVGKESDGTVYSPAIYPTSARTWKRIGYQITSDLMVLERGLASPTVAPTRHLVEVADWDAVLAVDRAAFTGFWRMSRIGLVEAAGATPTRMIFGYETEGTLVGYALVGVQRTASFLQRIAVDPAHAGNGIGRDLLRAAIIWAGRAGARSMLLNVREQSAPARRLYQTEGFRDTGTRLEILARHGLN